jgi:hypothetical protein
MQTNVYVDGFNLYYRCLKGTPYKWLNLLTLCQLSFPHHQINRIRYFTARVKRTIADPQKAQRQATLIRALETIPILSVHYGKFNTHRVWRQLAHPVPGCPEMVEVIDTKEKGSDVNLASYLLADGFQGEYELAIIVSNDSDLVAPVELVQAQLGCKVGILNPQGRRGGTAWDLMRTATFYRRIREGVLKASQFPPTLQDAHGTIRKPKEW